MREEREKMAVNEKERIIIERIERKKRKNEYKE